MSLTRKFLSGMGLTSEQVDATVDALKEEREAYKEDAEKYKDTKKEYDKLKKQLEEGSNDATEWQEKYESEHKAFEDFKKAEKAKETLKAVKGAYSQLLKDNNVGEKHIDSILGVTDFKEMKLDSDGKLVDADKLTEGIKSKWSGFITTTGTKGADVETPPTGHGTKYASKADIMKIKDTSERQQAIMDNPELFAK